MHRSQLVLASLLLLAGWPAACDDEPSVRRDDAEIADTLVDTGQTPDADTVSDTAEADEAEAEACEPPALADLPASWTLEDVGIRVTIERAPLRVQVANSAGQVVLTSLGAGQGDAYGALGFTRGTVRLSNPITIGWTSMSAHLEPWRDAWGVTAAALADGRLTLTLADPTGCERGAVQVVYAVGPSSLRVEATLSGADAPRAWAAAFETPPDEGFLGLGERFNRTNQRGVDVYSWAEEGGVGTGEGEPIGPANPFPNGEAMTYYPVPFFVSTEGYGFWLDSTWWNELNLATARGDAWRVWHIGDRLDFEVYLPVPGDARAWPLQLLDAFTARTGRPMLPPAWAYGPRRRINRGDVQGGVLEIQAMRDLDLAITALDDSVHFLPRGSHVGREAELAVWTEDARNLGYRVNGYYNSFLDKADDNPLAEEVARGVENGWFVKDAQGNPSEAWMVSGSLVFIYMVDFTLPEATAWFQGMLDWAVDLGYSGWMQDFGEYVLADSVASTGLPGLAYHNLYPVLYAKAVHDKMEAGPHAGDWLAFMRSGYTGSSAYSPMVWSGDPAASFEESDGLPSMVRAGVNLGLSGAPNWGGDINGFHCSADGFAAADEELLVRWIQQGAMSPAMQDQDACVAAFDQGRKANIFDDPLAQQAWRTWARLHTRLFPYLYTLGHEAHATGAPIMRHLFVEHPDRPDLADVDDVYYLGPALLVAPVVDRGAVTKTVPLPAGDYLLWHEARVLVGGGEVTVDAPLVVLPLFLRDGFLIPMLDPTIDTLAEESHAEVVGLADVDGVYDVVGFVGTATGSADATLWGGETLAVRWSGGFAAPGLAEAVDEAALSTCTECWRRDDLGGGLARVRITAADGELTAGGLTLTAATGRTTRWDLYLKE